LDATDMSLSTDTLFTAALGLQAPWQVQRVELSTANHRIDFEVDCTAKLLTCPHCGHADQGIHDRVSRSWRHLDFFQFEAWLHADVPRVACTACGKTTQVPVPWAREGSGFTLLLEAFALSLCKELPVAQAAKQLRVQDHRLWRRIKHYVEAARAQDDMSQVRQIGIDETSTKKGQQYITVVHDLPAKRLLFAKPGRDHQTVLDFSQDLQDHGGKPEQIEHVCMDMSGAFLKGVKQAMSEAAICYDRFHVAALAGQAMDEVRSAEFKADVKVVSEALGELDTKTRRSLTWAMRTHHERWRPRHILAMHALQRTHLKAARAWRMKTALRQVYEAAAQAQSEEVAKAGLKKWISWASRSRLEPFKRLAKTLQTHWDGVVAGMLQSRNNAYVEAMNGLLQQAKRAARGYRNTENFIAIAYLRMSKLVHLPTSPFESAKPRTQRFIRKCA
jgi:transposase